MSAASNAPAARAAEAQRAALAAGQVAHLLGVGVQLLDSFPAPDAPGAADALARLDAVLAGAAALNALAREVLEQAAAGAAPKRET